ncbi:MAG: hypothetical protein ABH843_02285 [Candidatus Omnitrophota bacterium]
MRRVLIIGIVIALIWLFMKNYEKVDLRKVFSYEPLLDKGLEKARGK